MSPFERPQLSPGKPKDLVPAGREKSRPSLRFFLRDSQNPDDSGDGAAFTIAMMLGSLGFLHDSLQLFALIPVAWAIMRWLQTRNVSYLGTYDSPARIFRRQSAAPAEPSALTQFGQRVREALVPEEADNDHSLAAASSQSGSSSSNR